MTDVGAGESLRENLCLVISNLKTCWMLDLICVQPELQ